MSTTPASTPPFAAAAAAGTPGDPNPLPEALRPYAAKVANAHDAVRQIRPGQHVFVGTACATPRALVAALEAWEFGPVDVELVHFLTDNAVPHDSQGITTTRYRHRSFFVSSDMRAAVRQGRGDYVPVSIARVPQLMALGRIAVDVALIQVSPPDEFGYFSLGVSVDVIPAAVANGGPAGLRDGLLHWGEGPRQRGKRRPRDNGDVPDGGLPRCDECGRHGMSTGGDRAADLPAGRRRCRRQRAEPGCLHRPW